MPDPNEEPTIPDTVGTETYEQSNGGPLPDGVPAGLRAALLGANETAA